MTRWDGESNESVYERCGMSTCANGVNCGGVEWVQSNTLKWFGHVERMGSEEFVKLYESELEGPNRRGRSLGRLKDRVEEYQGERGINPLNTRTRIQHPCSAREIYWDAFTASLLSIYMLFYLVV